MKKYYLIMAFFLLCLTRFNGFSQSNNVLIHRTSHIENLSIYPNPVSDNKVYISTKNNAPKKIEIFNVLGENILTVSIIQNELNISRLKTGVYIIKITENSINSTRKLIVK